MDNEQKKQYAEPEIEKIYVTADAVLASGDEDSGAGGSSGGSSGGGNAGEIDWF